VLSICVEMVGVARRIVGGDRIVRARSGMRSHVALAASPMAEGAPSGHSVLDAIGGSGRGRGGV